MIWDWMISPFAEFQFMRRALLGCVAVSLGATPVGVFLMLRRMSLTGDAMAHAILPGAAIGYLIAGLSLIAMTIGGLLAGLFVALVSGLVSRSTQLKEDASLAAFYLISLAWASLLCRCAGVTWILCIFYSVQCSHWIIMRLYYYARFQVSPPLH